MILWSTVGFRNVWPSKTHSKKAQTARANHRVCLDEHPAWNGHHETSSALELVTVARAGKAYRDPFHPGRN